jgi:hypothetical protein
MSFENSQRYGINFKCAIDFTNSMGFKESWSGFKTEAEYDYDSLFDTVRKLSGVTSYSASAGQCLKWCHYLQPYFEKAFGCKVWTTVGQFLGDDDYIYNPSMNDFKQWVNRGFQLDDFKNRKGLNLHAWLTMENGDLLDLSYPSTLANYFPESYGQYLGAVFIGKPEVYVPIIVGQKIIEEINIKTWFPLLATNEAELHRAPLALMPKL